MQTSSPGAALQPYSALGPAAQQIMDAFLQRTPPAATLLTGPRGIGKNQLANLLAMAHLCRAATHRPCQTCPDCRRFLSLTHPNVLSTASGSKERSIKIQQVRAVLNALAIHPLQAGGRVVLLLHADTLTTQAQNALLKSLEEPDASTLFLLSAENESAILPTILSRCRLVRLPAWDQRQTRALLAPQADCAPYLDELALLFQGRPYLAAELCQTQEYQRLRAIVQQAFVGLDSPEQLLKASNLLKDQKQDAPLLLELLESLLQAALRRYELPPAFQSGTIKWQQVPLEALARVLRQIMAARRALNSNVSWQAVADQLIFVIAKEIYQCPW